MSREPSSFQFEDGSNFPNFGVVEFGEESGAEQGSMTGGVLVQDQNPDQNPEEDFPWDSIEGEEESSGSGFNSLGSSGMNFSSSQPPQQQFQQPAFGRGMGGMGLGQGGAHRFKRPLRDSITGITKNTLQKFCKKAGIANTSGLVYEELRMLIKAFLEKILKSSITYMEYARKRTLTEEHVYNGLRFADMKEFRVDRSYTPDYTQSDKMNDALSKPAVIRMARRGGVLSQSSDVYDEVRTAMYEFLRRNIRDAISITGSEGRKVLTSNDVVKALENNGHKLLGFGN